MNRLLPPRATLFLLILFLSLMSFASNPIMQSLVKVSDTRLDLYFNESVQISGSYTSGFTLQDCRGIAFVVQSISDGTANDQIIELTVDDLTTALGDLNLTYFNLNDPIEDLQGNVFDTDGIGVQLLAADKFQIEGSSITGNSFTPAENLDPQSHAFNADGTKLYILGLDNDATVYEYNLSTPFDITTASYTNASLNVESQDSNPLHLLFNNDGSRLYVTGFLTNSIYEFGLSTNYDLSTASLISGHAVPVGGLISGAFNKDGTVFYSLDNADWIRGFALSSPFDLTSLPSSINGTTAFQTGLNVGVSFSFNNDGTRLFTVGRFERTLRQYQLTTPYDITTTVFESSASLNAVGSRVGTVVFSDNGDRMFAMGTTTKVLYEFNVADIEGPQMVGLAKVSDTELQVFFNENVLAAESFPNNFSVIKDGSPVPVDGVADGTLGDNTVSLLFSSPNDLAGASTDIVVTYADASSNNEILDYSCNPMPDDAVGQTLTIELVAPILTDLTVNSETELLLTFDEVIQVTGTDASNFLITDCRGNMLVPTTISDPQTLDNEILLTIPELNFPNGDVTIAYTDPGNGAVSDIFGNVLANFNATVANSTDLTDPTLESFTKISATALELTYSEPVTAYESSPANFSLFDGTNTVQATAIADGTLEDNTISIDFGVAIAGTTLTLTYDNGSGNDEIADLSCNPVATDLVGVTEIFESTPPEVDRAFKVDINRIAVIFSEPVQLSGSFGAANVNVADCDGNSIAVQSIINGAVNDNKIEIETDLLSQIEGELTMTITSPVNEIIDLSANNLLNGSGVATVSDVFRPGEAVSNGVQLSISDTFTFPSAITFDDTGLNMFISGLDIDELRRYQLTTPFDISTATLSADAMDLSIEFDVPLGVSFNPSGTILYITGTPASGKTDYVNQYTLSNPFDITTAVLASGYDTDTNISEDIPLGVSFNADGSKMFIAGTRNDLVYEFDLSSNYDISSLTYLGAGETFNFAANSTTDVVAFGFDPTGYLMYVQAQGQGRLVEYLLESPFDVSTASYNGFNNDLSFPSANTPRGFTFSAAGDRLFIVETNSDQVWQLDVADLQGPNFDSFDFISTTQTDLLFDEIVKVAGANPGDLTFTDFSGSGSPIGATAIAGLTTSDTRINVTVDLTNAVGDVEVSYVDGNNEITDLSCNPLAAGVLGTIDLDQVAPNLVSGALTGATEITLTFDEPVQTNGGNPTDFTVTDGLGNTYPVSSQQDGTAQDAELVLSFSDLNNIVGDLTVTYTNANNEINDFGGNAFDTNTEGITIDLDQTAPSISTVAISGTDQIEVTYSERIQLRTYANNFQAFDGAMNELAIANVLDGTVNDEVLTLEVSDLATALGDVTVAYTTAGFVEDFGGNQANTNPGVLIDLDQNAPTLTSVSKVTDTELLLIFSEPVQTSGANANDFEVIDNMNASIQVLSIADGIAQDNELTLTVGDLTLVDNTITVTYIAGNAVVTDFGGNSLATDNVGVTIDIVAPEPPQLTGIDSDNGESSNDLITNDNTLLYVGTAEANSTVEALLDGVVQTSTTANATGDFVFDFTATSSMDGVFNASFVATDASGNSSDPSATFVITIDTDVPEVTAIARLNADGLEDAVTEVSYEVSFDEDVYNLEATDFALVTSGSVTADIGTITPTDLRTYTVEIQNIDGGQGDAFGLNFQDDDSVNDLAGNAVGGAGAGNGNFTGEVYSFKTPQTITFDQDLTGKTYGDADFTLVATASSSLPVSFSVAGPVSLNGNTVTIEGAGEATITASQAGDDDFAAATSVTQTLTISKATLAVSADDQQAIFDQTLPVLTISYTGFVGLDEIADIDTEPVASSTATVGSDAGTYPITVAGGVDDDYDFTYQDGTLTVNKADQSITFDPISSIDLADVNTVNLVATASSGLVVAFSVASGDGVISGSTLTVNGTGNFTMDASQAGNQNWNAATVVSQTFQATDSRKTDQTITFAAISEQEYGDQLTLGATASSGLAVTYLLNSGTGAITNGLLTIEGVGAYEITASQVGDDSFNPAQDVTQTFNVLEATLTATADDQAIQEGDAIPTLSITYSGFKLADSEASIDALPTATTTATPQSDAGTYDIVLNGGSDANYTFQLVNGTLTIEQVLGFDNDPFITLYPNPVTNRLAVKGLQEGSINIDDMTGKTILSSRNLQVDLSGIRSGTYLVTVRNADGLAVVKYRIIKE